MDYFSHPWHRAYTNIATVRYPSIYLSLGVGAVLFVGFCRCARLSKRADGVRSLARTALVALSLSAVEQTWHKKRRPRSATTLKSKWRNPRDALVQFPNIIALVM